MRLIKTNDGLIGWKNSDYVVWCSNMQEVYNIGWIQIGRIKSLDEKQNFREEVNLAVDMMTSLGHSMAHFGVLGNFIYSELE